MPNDVAGIPLQTFDPEAEFSVVERKLPHWSQAGTVAFITWRTWDSMPRAVVDRWISEREDWLARNGINCGQADWNLKLARLTESQLYEFRTLMAERWNGELDQCHGRCVLRNPDAAGIVADSLHHFDGDRYNLSAFVVMPNHVHILVAFRDEEGMLNQCESWKHYTATKLNRMIGRRGRFWEVDDFDHLVRSTEAFDHYCRYIADNPRRAQLKPGEFLLYRK